MNKIIRLLLIGMVSTLSAQTATIKNSIVGYSTLGDTVSFDKPYVWSFIKGDKIVMSKVDGINIGLTICYDLRFPNLYRQLAKIGAQIILIPAAFTVPTGKVHWETLIRARAIENSVFIVATNMCGTHHSGRKTYGHSILFDPWGRMENKCVSKPKILNTAIDLNEISRVRLKLPSIYND